MTPEERQVARCRMDFIAEYNYGRGVAGGGPDVDTLLKMTVEDVIYRLAHNGFRLSAAKCWHMDKYKEESK